MAVIDTGTSTAGKANVDSNFNLQVNTPVTEGQAGFVALSSEVDAGSITGIRTQRALEVSPDYRLRVGTDTLLFTTNFEGTNIARDKIQQNDTTATAAQASGFLSLNSGGSITINQGCNIRTYRTFPVIASTMIHGHFIVREQNPTATNAVTEFGFGFVSGVTALPTDGIFFRRLSGGQLQGVCNFNGTEAGVTTINLNPTNVANRSGVGLYNSAEVQHYIIYIHNDEVSFWVNDIMLGTIACPPNQSSLSSASSLPLFARVWNSGAASAARKLDLGALEVTLGELSSNKTWASQMSGMGNCSYQQPSGVSGPTVTRTAATNGYPASTVAKTTTVWAANTGPGSGQPSDLGGRWLSPAMSTLVSETDYPVFSYLNPAGTATTPGKVLFITDIRVGETIATAAAATNTMILIFSIAVGSTGQSVATTEAATTVAPRIMPIGSGFFSATAPIGTTLPGFTVDLSTAIAVLPGTYFHFIVRPVGTVTTNTLVVAGTLFVNGYFE